MKKKEEEEKTKTKHTHTVVHTSGMYTNEHQTQTHFTYTARHFCPNLLKVEEVRSPRL